MMPIKMDIIHHPNKIIIAKNRILRNVILLNIMRYDI